jgi:hypothetical protein
MALLSLPVLHAGSNLSKYHINSISNNKVLLFIIQVERMEDSRMPKRVMKGKIYIKRRRCRPKVRWLDSVQEELTGDGD